MQTFDGATHLIMTVRDTYRQTPNKRINLVGNKIVDLPDVVGASPVGAASTIF